MFENLNLYLESNSEILGSGYKLSTLKKHHPIFYQQILQIDLFKKSNFPLKKILFHIVNNIQEIQLCQICHLRECVFYNLEKGYSRTCSVICSRQDPTWKEKSHQNIDYQKRTLKTKETVFKKYNVNNISQISEIKEKKKETCLKNYGVDHPLKVLDIAKQVSLKNIEKMSLTKEKIKKTNNEKYGCDFFTQSQTFKNILTDLWLNQEYRDNHSKKIKQYYLDNPEAKIEIGEKTKHYWQTLSDNDREEYSQKMRHILNEIYSNKDVKSNIIEKQKQTVINNIDIYDSIKGSECSQKIIKDILDNNHIEYLIKDRNIIKPFELDFYIPSKNLSIEVNGIYFHSDLFVKSSYHYDKYLKCQEKNIKLLQFFEDDLIFKKEIIESIILNSLNIHNQIIHGRKCQIKEIDSKLKSQFLKENHLMGNDKSIVNIGAFHNDQLISVMTFHKGNFTINHSKENFDWELSRFCVKKFFKVHGIAGKMFKFFVNRFDHIKIITYSSLLTGDGKTYEKIGFKFSHLTKPGYFYFKNFKRYHRYISLTLRTNKCISERDDMFNQGFLKISDVGNNKFVYSKNLNENGD